jgi:3-oxoacyl-[acyl-carrier protein] reductase
VPAIPLEGKSAIVTGASSGFGKAIADALRAEGVKVAVGARRAERLEGDFAHELDVTDPASAERFVAAAVEALGGLDIVVNNAATLVRREFQALELDDLDAAWEVNLRAPALIMQESFEYLRRAEAPAIVNVVSTAGVNGGIATVSAYGMSKAGLIVLTKAVAREYGPHGIRVFALSPPSLDSEMQRSLPTEYRERVRAMNVLGRLAPPEEVARFTLLTASGVGGLVTGTMVDLTATAY